MTAVFTVPGSLVLSQLTAGSLLFLGSGSVVSQDSTNLFWDNTNKFLGINTNSPTQALDVRANNVSGGVVRIQNGTNGFTSIAWFASDSTQKMAVMYGNPGPGAPYAGKFNFFGSVNTQWLDISSNPAMEFVPVLNTVKLEFNNGGSAAVSSANRGALRYNTTGQKAQWSFNGGSFFDAGTYAAPITAGSILFANGSNQIDQDNANLFWDNTGKHFIVGASAITKPTNGNFTHEFTKNTTNIVAISAYGTGISPAIYLYHGRGTAASTTALLSGDLLGQWVWVGAIASGDSATAGAILQSVTTENWAGNNCGNRFELYNIPNGSGAAGRVQRLAIEHDGAWVMTNSATAGNSLASEVRMRNSSNKLQFSFNAGSYFDAATYAAALTTGSIPFANASNQLAQDNANLFWDNTNKVMGIGLATPDSGRRLHLSINTAGAPLALETTVAAGTGGAVFKQSGTVHGGVGFAESTAGQTANQDRIFLQGTDKDVVVTVGNLGSSRVAIYAALSTTTVGVHNTAPGCALDVGVVAGTATALAVRGGSTAAVSAASTGRFRYDESSQKFQASHNGGSYFDVATYAAAITTGSILFANASNQLAQDNANFFWDNTNKRLGIGTSPTYTLHVKNTNTNQPVGRLEHTSTGGYVALEYVDSSAALQASFGYGNSTVSITYLQSQVFIYSATAKDIVFANATKSEFIHGMTDGSTFLQMADGASAAVSASGTMRLRYNAGTDKFQVSKNGAAYVDVA